MQTTMSERHTRVTRRDFLKLISVGAVSAALTSCDFDLSGKSYDRETSLKISEFLKTTYKFNNFYFGEGFIAGRNDLHTSPIAFGSRNAIATLESLSGTLSLYPPEFYNNLAVSTQWGYLVGENLSHFNSDKSVWEDWAGTITTSFAGENIICAERNGLPRLTHHEMFHLITKSLTDQLLLYSEFSMINSNNGIGPYSENESFNSVTQCLDSPPLPGFSRCYGNWNASEDSATIAESLMTGNPEFYGRLNTDSVLLEKAELVKLVYEKVSSGRMNPDFFESRKSQVQNPWVRPEIPEELYS